MIKVQENTTVLTVTHINVLRHRKGIPYHHDYKYEYQFNFGEVYCQSFKQL